MIFATRLVLRMAGESLSGMQHFGLQKNLLAIHGLVKISK
jgi:hypothetical protein